METLPLASILFVNVETKRSIPQLTNFVLHSVTWLRLSSLSLTTLLAESRPSGPASFQAAGARNACRLKQLRKGPWRSLDFGPSTKSAPSHGVLPGADGPLWDRMGFDGRQRIIKDISWCE